MGTLRKAERFKAALCWGVVRCVLLVAAVLGVAGVSSGAPAAVSNDKKYSCIRVNVIGMPNSGEVQSRKAMLLMLVRPEGSVTEVSEVQP